MSGLIKTQADAIRELRRLRMVAAQLTIELEDLKRDVSANDSPLPHFRGVLEGAKENAVTIQSRLVDAETFLPDHLRYLAHR